MALQEFLDQLDQLVSEAETNFGAAESTDALEEARIEFLGAKNGKLKAVQKLMGTVEKQDKPVAGKTFNETKGRIESAFEVAHARIQGDGSDTESDSQFDPSLPGSGFKIGRVHPITQTIEELKDIMGRLGFSTVDGPEIEDDWHNFVALNIPDDHPARDCLLYASPSARDQRG